jgi:hypothetical protein
MKIVFAVAMFTAVIVVERLSLKIAIDALTPFLLVAMEVALLMSLVVYSFVGYLKSLLFVSAKSLHYYC